MEKAMTKKQTGFLIFLCWAAYTTAYIGRLNYNASMVEILSQLGTTKEVAGAVSSCFFFAYGAGQLVNGLLSKRYNTKYSVAVALAASAVINVAMTLAPDMGFMKILWFANGVFQSVLWSSLIKTLSLYLGGESLPKAVMVMSTTVAVGTFGAYGLAALFSGIEADWTAIFYVAAVVLGAVAAVWFIGMGRIEKCEKAVVAHSEAGAKGKFTVTPLFVVSTAVLLVSAVANGFIKDGATTWVPSILKEEFGVSNSLSIIITLVLPILSIFGASLVKALHKRQKNTNILNGIFFLGTTVLTGAIILTFSIRSAAVTLLLFGGTACLMSAVNNVITSIIPLYARDKMDSGLLAGLLNTFCYIGSTLSITLLGKIADTRGWNDVFICILIFSAVSLVLCLVSTVAEKKRA